MNTETTQDEETTTDEQQTTAKDQKAPCPHNNIMDCGEGWKWCLDCGERWKE